MPSKSPYEDAENTRHRGRIAVQLFSILTGHDSVVSVHKNLNTFYCLAKSNPVTLDTMCTVDLSSMVSVLWRTLK